MLERHGSEFNISREKRNAWPRLSLQANRDPDDNGSFAPRRLLSTAAYRLAPIQCLHSALCIATAGSHHVSLPARTTISRMSRAKQTATLSGMIDGDMEEDTLAGNAFPSPDSNQENTGPPARKVGRTKTKPAAKRFTKPPSRRTSRSSTTAQKQKVTKTKAGGKRAPLLDQTNRQYEGDTEEVDDLPLQATQEGLVAEEAEIRPKGKRKAPPKESDKLPRKAASRQIGAKEKDGEFEYTPTTARTKNVSQSNGPGRQTSAQPRQGNRGVQASQSGADIEPLEPSPVLPRYHEPSCRGFGGARSESQPRRQNPIKRYRAGSASDTERAGDPAIRRKLGDVTRKFETLDLKYRNLREIGIKEADANFEKLRVQSEARAKGTVFSLHFQHELT